MRSIELDDYNCARSRRDGKQDWGELYRAAILESDESMLQQRIKDAWGAISDRSASLAKRTDSHGKEQDDIARALHMLSLLQRQPRH
ncbi:MAG TPA: hypothetical protein VFV92_06035 [Candidatus Bathyarchaeia archaeon]|jgi:hypothetical protein|nr:hypothetical protein [Candidatus Bathyarchaeia archaeon]